MVSLPDELLGQIDAAAKRRGTTRSGLLAATVRRELAQPTPAAVRDAVALLEDCSLPYRSSRLRTSVSSGQDLRTTRRRHYRLPVEHGETATARSIAQRHVAH